MAVAPFTAGQAVAAGAEHGVEHRSSRAEQAVMQADGLHAVLAADVDVNCRHRDLPSLARLSASVGGRPVAWPQLAGVTATAIAAALREKAWLLRGAIGIPRRPWLGHADGQLLQIRFERGRTPELSFAAGSAVGGV